NNSRSEDANVSKKAILEILPEASADDDSVVDQLEQHAPVCKANDVISEVLSEVNFKSPEEREMDKFLNEAHKKNKIFDDSDEIELTKNQNIELDLRNGMLITIPDPIETPPEITTQSLINSFRKIIRSGHEEILSWIRYSDNFENK
ncbi:16327_t:CDS:2, partial [Acaulospora colombiana]